MRLFVAILLNDASRAGLEAVQRRLAPRCPDVRWVPKDQLHLTVQFLGDVPDGDVAAIGQALSSGAKSVAGFEMGIEGCGVFPPRGPVRIVWAGANEPSGTMPRCVAEVHAALRAVGYPPEDRPWSPHITIGRVKEDRSGGRLREMVEVCACGPWLTRVDSVTLMSSVLSPKGPTYTPVSAAKLG